MSIYLRICGTNFNASLISRIFRTDQYLFLFHADVLIFSHSFMPFANRLYLFKGLLQPLLLLSGLILGGTVGYMIIEHYHFLEALFMTVITVASVGFNEVHPLSEAGQVFTIILILVNLGLFTYFITLLSKYFFDTDVVNKYKLMKMENRIQQLQQHVIICGFGRNGKESAQVLHDNKIPFVVLESKDDASDSLGFDVPYLLKGDATKDEVLLQAGIKDAKAIIVTLPVDADNLFVVLTARQLNPGITIISRASNDSSIKKLKIAGASNVIMPDKIGGAHMATLVMLPDVVELLSIMSTRNNADFRVAELKAQKTFVLSEMDLWKKTNCTILGIKDSSGHYTVNPPASYAVNAGQSMIVMGSDAQIENARRMV
ncbi:MAG: potassium channel family protein [Bacteroidetes bacterium]|nr:potassium channel family protein [Bacteroidota bacterium]